MELELSSLHRHIGTIVSSHDVLDLVRDIHGEEQDWEEGDLRDRIIEFDQYRLEELSLSEVDLDEWRLDDDHVAHLVQEIGETSVYYPIVFDGHNKSLIDGTHRSNALAQLGHKSILAFVATPSIGSTLRDRLSAMRNISTPADSDWNRALDAAIEALDEFPRSAPAQVADQTVSDAPKGWLFEHRGDIELIQNFNGGYSKQLREMGYSYEPLYSRDQLHNSAEASHD